MSACKAYNLTTFMRRLSINYGRLNLLQHQGTVQAYMRIALPLLLYWHSKRKARGGGSCAKSHVVALKQLKLLLLFFFLYFADRASQYIYLNINQLDALNFYNEFISCLYMFRAQVLIIRRPKLYYTASGIITLKQVSGLKLLK